MTDWLKSNMEDPEFRRLFEREEVIENFIMAQRKQTPEEIELQQKEEILSENENILADLELSLSTLQADLRSFEVGYFFKVGSKYVEIDELQATLDKILASKMPFDAKAKERAKESEE